MTDRSTATLGGDSPAVSAKPPAEAAPDGVFGRHDHADCAATAMAAAEKACEAAGLRLTPTRRKVLEYLWESHKPVGAYRLLERLSEDGFSSKPPSVYRALDFLVEHGLAHKLRSKAAYLGCSHPDQAHAPQFLICRGCDAIEEFVDDTLAERVEQAARRSGFEPALTALEVEGWCPACRRDGVDR